MLLQTSYLSTWITLKTSLRSSRTMAQVWKKKEKRFFTRPFLGQGKCFIYLTSGVVWYVENVLFTLPLSEGIYPLQRGSHVNKIHNSLFSLLHLHNRFSAYKYMYQSEMQGCMGHHRVQWVKPWNQVITNDAASDSLPVNLNHSQSSFPLLPYDGTGVKEKIKNTFLYDRFSWKIFIYPPSRVVR